jgi:amino acid adenylation domain-containing protein/non-ribosomal peptide synthase protein (TIGR01720 family)
MAEEKTKQAKFRKELIQDIYPCTPLQEGLMALSIDRPAAYVAQNTFELANSVDIARFRRAWEAVLMATDIMRTRIVTSEKAGAMQVVLKAEETPEWQTATNLREYSDGARNQPVEYGAPLVQLGLVTDDNTGRRYFVLTTHHAVFDAWSMALILQQAEAAYRTGSAPQSQLLPFKLFIRSLRAGQMSSDEAFWTGYLEGAETPEFPVLPSVAFVARARARCDFSMRMTTGGPRTITAGTYVRAAWAILLARYAAIDDVTFGMTLSGRDANVRGIEQVVGPTITTVPVRVRVPSMTTVAEYLQQVQAEVTAMIPRQHAGLQRIRKMSPSARTACQFRTLVVVQPALARGKGGQDQGASSLGMTHVPNELPGFHTYALVVEVKLSTDEWTLEAQYDETVINQAQVQRILHQFEHIVSQLLIGKGTRPLQETGTVSDFDTDQIRQWNAALPPRIEECVHDRILEHTQNQPHDEAVCAWDGSFTYRELGQRSEQLAQYLSGRGVGPGVKVPLCFEKSKWAIVAMLAVLRCGAAFVPLDPNHPEGRLRTIVQAVDATIAVAGGSVASILARIVPKVLTVDATSPWNEHQENEVLSTQAVRPDNLAVVMFTSGSTGEPKGVLLRHDNIVTSAQAHGHVLRINRQSRVFQFAAYTFDISLQDILTTLIRGGCVCVPSEEDRMNNLAGAINQMQANHACITPTVAGLLTPAEVPSMKTLTLAGEAITQTAADIWSAAVALNNCYGPAECTIYCAWQGQVGKAGRVGDIGRAIGGALWVVDRDNPQRLVPIGVTGELVVEGPIVSDGYLNDPARTAQSFLDNPAWLQLVNRSGRVYRTGDLVRYNADGSLRYLGRGDNQIKLHGQRIELAEIETNILHNASVQAALAMLPRKGRCANKIVALLSFQGQNAGRREIRVLEGAAREAATAQMSRVHEHLSSLLPEYMVPTLWLALESLPLNTSGKIDRARLLKWVEGMDEELYQEALSALDNDSAETMVTTDLDMALQAAIAKTLNLSEFKLSMGKSFVRLGGDSITAMQLVARCRAEGILIKVHDVLQSPSIGQLVLAARRLDKTETQHYEEVVDQWFDLSPMQMFYFTLAGQEVNHTNQSLFLRLVQEASITDLNGVIESVVRKHSMLRSRFGRDEGVWKQRITTDVTGSYRFQAHDVDSRADIAARMVSSQAAIDPIRGPLMTADVFNVKGDGQLLYIVVHHLVIDLLSWRTVLADLESLRKIRQPAPMQPLSFQAWVAAQARHAQEHFQVDRVLPYEVPPADFEYWGMGGQPNVQADVTTESFLLDQSITQQLLAECNTPFGTEPVELFLAALNYSFNDTFSDRPLPAIYTEGHGRESWDQAAWDLGGTVGWFTTISPLHISTVSPVSEAVRHTKDRRRSLPQHGWPYFAARYLTDEGRARYGDHSRMELLFNYMGQFQQLESADAVLKPEQKHGLEVAVSNIGSTVTRMALIDVSIVILHGVARFDIAFSKRMAKQDLIRGWVQQYKKALVEMSTVLSSTSPQRTLADFPLWKATHTELDQVRALNFPGGSFDEIVEDIYPTSPMQQALFLSQSRQDGLYETAFIFRVTTGSGLVDVNRLLDAWNRVVNRHAILRTVFLENASGNGLFDQVVLREVSPSTLCIQAESNSALVALEQCPRSSTSGDANALRPLHRFVICEATSKEVLVRLEASHAILDAASIGLMIRDLQLAYDGLLPEGRAPLYSDYIRYIQGKSDGAAVQYWTAHLADAEPCIFPSTWSNETPELKSTDVELSVSLAQLTQLGETISATVPNILRAAWILVLRAYTLSEDVCFGYLAYGRDVPVEGIQDIVGPFINILVCRLAVVTSDSLAALVQKVQGDYAASLEHQHFSLAQIQHELGQSRRKLFNTILSIQQGQSGRNMQTGLNFENVDAYDPTEVRLLERQKDGGTLIHDI